MNDRELTAQLAEFEKKLANFHIPRFRELPEIDLYMDQVIAYVNKCFLLFDDAAITPSMINNYVKIGIVPAPVGKKYGRNHLAYILAVYFLKQVLKMEEIKNIVFHQIKLNNEYKAYTYFCDALERSFKNCCFLTGDPQDNAKAALESDRLALKSCTASIANLIYARKVIELHAEADKEAQEALAEKAKEEAETEKAKNKKEKKK